MGIKKRPRCKCIKDERKNAAIPPCFAHLLAEAASESANTLLRVHGRTRRNLCRSGRSRSSETMFGELFRTSFHHPRLSVTYLSAYSSLHRLCHIHFWQFV